MAGKTLAAAGMSERPARNWRTGTQLAERGVAVDGGRRCGRGRTREDPFADLWQSEVVPQLVTDTDGRLQVRTLFTALCRRQPGRFQPGQPTEVAAAGSASVAGGSNGPEREVYFEQAGNLISCTYVDLRDPVDRPPITTLTKASSKRHAIPGLRDDSPLEAEPLPGSRRRTDRARRRRTCFRHESRDGTDGGPRLI